MHNNLLFPLENLYDSSWNQKNSKKMPLNIDSFSNEECEEYDEYSYTLSNTQKEINILSLEDYISNTFINVMFRIDIEIFVFFTQSLLFIFYFIRKWMLLK